MPPAYEESRTFSSPLEEVRTAASDALTSIGAKVEVSDDGTTLSGTTGWTLFSFGEKLEIELKPRGDKVDVRVHSTQRVRIALADLGSRNRKNVGAVVNAMATRLG